MALTGYVLSEDCGQNASGVLSVHLAIKKEVISFTKLNKAFTDVTMAVDGVFVLFEGMDGTITYNANIIAEGSTTAIEHTITIPNRKFSDYLTQSLQTINDDSYCGIIAIVTLVNGHKFVVGYDDLIGSAKPLRVAASDLTSGDTLTSQSGGSLVLTCQTPRFPLMFKGVIPVAA